MSTSNDRLAEYVRKKYPGIEDSIDYKFYKIACAIRNIRQIFKKRNIGEISEMEPYEDPIEYYEGEEDAKAFDMAIEELKAEPRQHHLGKHADITVIDEVATHDKRTETHACDCISKQAVRKVISENYRRLGLTDSAMTELSNEVKSLPPVTPTERTGEWLDRCDGGRIKYPWWESCECSKCGEYGSGAYNYCPNCGAKMGGDME